MTVPAAPNATSKLTVRFLRAPAVIDRIGVSRRTFHAMVAAGTFPKPVRPTKGTRAWLEPEVDAWMEARIAERDRRG